LGCFRGYFRVCLVKFFFRRIDERNDAYGTSRGKKITRPLLKRWQRSFRFVGTAGGGGGFLAGFRGRGGEAYHLQYTYRALLFPNVPTAPTNKNWILRLSSFISSIYGFNNTLLTLRNPIAPINLQRLFLSAAHQINIDLRHAGRFELLQPPSLFFGSPDNAEAIDHLVGDEFGVAAADFGVMQVVVTF